MLGLLNGICVPVDRLRDTSRKFMIFFVGFDCDFKAMLAEDITKILLNFFCLMGQGLGYAKTVISIQAKIVVMCVCNVV